MDIDMVLVGSPSAGYSARTLSGYLKANGHSTRLLYLPYPLQKGLGSRFPPEVLEALRDFVSGSRMVCVSSADGDYFCWTAIKQLLIALGDTDVFREAGGNTVSVHPESMIPHAEAVCIGQGEQALLELVTRLEEGKPYLDTPGFYFREGERIIRNPPRPICNDMDRLGIPDYCPENHFVLRGGNIRPLSESDLVTPTNPFRQIVITTSRGCPNNCAYCQETADSQHGYKSIPAYRRPLPAVFEELSVIKKTFPRLQYLTFYDRDFLSRPFDEIREFSAFYAENIRLPFGCLTSPKSITRQKLDLLIDAGLRDLGVGMQSGSQHTNVENYNRQTSREGLEKTIAFLNDYRFRVHLRYLFITRNPKETSVDLKSTLSLLKKIEAPAFFETNPLDYIPSTALYNQEVDSGNLMPFESMDTYRGFVGTGAWHPGHSKFDYEYLLRAPMQREQTGDKRTADALDWILHSLQGNWSAIRKGWLLPGMLPLLEQLAETPLAPHLPWIMCKYATAAQGVYSVAKGAYGRVIRSRYLPAGTSPAGAYLRKALQKALWL